MEEWPKNFTLDIEVNGEPFNPYDPDAPPLALSHHKESLLLFPQHLEYVLSRVLFAVH